MRMFAPMFGLDPDSNLGGEIYDVNILTGLARKGHVIDVIIRKGQKVPHERNINVHTFPLATNPFCFSVLLFPIIFLMPSFRKIISEADVFRVHSPFFLGFWAVMGRLLFRKYPKLLFHYHHVDNKTEMKVFDRILPRHANCLTFLCTETRSDLMIRSGIGGTPFSIIPPGIDTKTFRPVKNGVRKRLGIGSDQKIILYVGALIPRKGIDVLMKSWERLKSFGNVHLVVIGQGPLRKLLKGERLHYIPYVEKSELVEFYNAADVFAFPTRLEGFGMTPAEAMACETPVVTTNAKGVRDVVSDDTGFRVEVDDVNDFTEKLKFLLKDGTARSAMGRRAAKRIRENFTWPGSVNRTEDFIMGMVKHAKD
jgi:glycosyltransferase involved in cell wall biosynthesis